MTAQDDALQTVTIDELCALLHLSRSTIARMVTRGELPAPRLVADRRPRWCRADLARWLARRPRASATESGIRPR
jgi:excisionase family DNA binding protein